MAIRASCLTLTALLSLTSAQSPIEVTFSSRSYGFDGPWNAVSVGIGNPPQNVDLIPGAIWWTNVLTPAFCDNSTFSDLGVDCYPREAGFYDNSSSTTAVWSRIPEGHPGWTQVPAQGGISNNVLDQMKIGGTTIANVSLLTADWAYGMYEPEGNFPSYVGQLSLGAPAESQNVNGIEAALPPQQLYRTGLTPSGSFGLHLGSAASLVKPSIKGSLWFGGYDRSRTLGPILSQPFIPGGPSFSVDLHDLSFLGPDGTNSSGLLQSGNSSIGNSISVGLMPWSAYIVLPASTCDALTADLPIYWDENLAFYIWNTSSPNYSEAMIKSKSYYTFSFSSASSNLPIKIPLALLHLTLAPPLVEKEVPYFPCIRATDDGYLLGQAFLQAAFLGANWMPDSGQAYWTLAQAPGPGYARTPYVTTINNDDTQDTVLQGYENGDWESTWADFWGDSTNSSSPAAGSGASSDAGLSTGAKAGIGVGVAFGAIAVSGLLVFFFSRRREDSKRRNATSNPLQGKHTELESGDISGDEMLGPRNDQMPMQQSQERAWHRSDTFGPYEIDSNSIARNSAVLSGKGDFSPGGRLNPVETAAEERRWELPNRSNELRAELA